MQVVDEAHLRNKENRTRICLQVSVHASINRYGDAKRPQGRGTHPGVGCHGGRGPAVYPQAQPAATPVTWYAPRPQSLPGDIHLHNPQTLNAFQ